MIVGLKSRKSRLGQNHGGGWCSFSPDFARLAIRLFEQSEAEARANPDGNCSSYPLAGIPMLFSALHCLLVEIHSGLYTGELPDSAKLSELARADDIPFITKYHPLPNDLLEKLELLWQVRHEIVHPSPRPSGETNNTQSYLVRLRQE